jgi:hypothetical protein
MEFLLSPQLNTLPARYVPRVVKPVTRVVATVTLCGQAWHESVIELSPKHAGLIFLFANVLHDFGPKVE